MDETLGRLNSRSDVSSRVSLKSACHMSKRRLVEGLIAYITGISYEAFSFTSVPASFLHPFSTTTASSSEGEHATRSNYSLLLSIPHSRINIYINLTNKVGQVPKILAIIWEGEAGMLGEELQGPNIMYIIQLASFPDF